MPSPQKFHDEIDILRKYAPLRISNVLRNTPQGYYTSFRSEKGDQPSWFAQEWGGSWENETFSAEIGKVLGKLVPIGHPGS